MASIASFPVEILLLIFTYLECFADITSVAGVCKEWRSAVHQRLRASQQEEPRYRQLPWLLQPSYDAPPSTITSFVSGTTGRRICLPEGIRRRDRFCGSHEGGWVAVAGNRRGRRYYQLVNLINQAIASIPLPGALHCSSHSRRSEAVDIRMVTLSDVPTAKSCIAAALTVHTVGGCPSIIFCRPHVDCHWLPMLMDRETLQDTLYYRGEVFQGFYAISSRDILYVFMPSESNNGETLEMRQIGISFQPVEATAELSMADSGITRYLVESRGKLLMVARFSGRTTGLDRRTLRFRVFELLIFPVPNVGHSAGWAELNGSDLDGRVITVAKGCSRSFEAVQCKGFQGGSIYFLDDAVGAGGMNPVFSFADFGMYSLGEKKIERPSLPTPALQGSLDGAFQESFQLSMRPNKRAHGSSKRASSIAGHCEAVSKSLYGPRELMVRTIRMSHATGQFTSRLQIVSKIDQVANDEASSSTPADGEQVVHETMASVWPLLCKTGKHRPVWFMPPSVDEWLLPPPAAADA